MSWNHFSFVNNLNISPTIVIDTSMEWSSRVLQHRNIKILFFSKEFEIEFRLVFRLTFFFLSSKLNFDLYFDLCQRDEIIHVGLNMHIYDDIGDASSSLRGSTSSFVYRLPLNRIISTVFLISYIIYHSLYHIYRCSHFIYRLPLNHII